MSKYVLSPNAARSLERIADHSVREFGRQRAAAYLKDIADKFDYLAQAPDRGRKRDEIKPGYLSYFVGSHTIYYKVVADKIEVIDVLQQAMEPRRHLLEDNPHQK